MARKQYFRSEPFKIHKLEATGMDLEANSSFIVCIAQKRMPNYLLARWQEEVAEELTFSTKRNSQKVVSNALWHIQYGVKCTNLSWKIAQYNYGAQLTMATISWKLRCPIDNGNHKPSIAQIGGVSPFVFCKRKQGGEGD